jgi:phosphoketolase
MNRTDIELPQIARQDLLCEARAKELRQRDPQLRSWAAGNSVLAHGSETQCRVHDLVDRLAGAGSGVSEKDLYRLFAAADDIASAAMWTVVHMTYARRVHIDGRPLEHKDFKQSPEGHTGGSLNMVPAYVGYMLANAITGVTRSWIMGQGHCVAAIEAVNILTRNLTPKQAERYAWTGEGLTNLVTDFYGYAIDPAGRPAGLVGSHVNANTAGGISEGGYLGFAEVEYVHMPLKNERLVAFLSDGAFEEQRGSDWAPRWWRHEDSGLVSPIMILNGRRIEQRTEMALEGGADWLRAHLTLSGFDPIDIDGRDPAAFAWAILEMESRLSVRGEAAASGKIGYPVPLPYAIANTIKGYGFPGAGTNRAHNLPLAGNPSQDIESKEEFNAGAARLWVEPDRLAASVKLFQNHDLQRRVLERDHPLACRSVAVPRLPEWETDGMPVGTKASPMEYLDRYFVEIVKANPELRPRVGNPDELQSNRMGRTLEYLKHRVNRPEPSVAEAVNGAIVTVLNEEAVIGAVLGNKGGINIAVTYEAFAVKMLGAVRQEIIFARAKKERGYAQGWLAIPVVVTSHTWENGKNEQSHQDPTFCEALLGEMSDTARVFFPADACSAVMTLSQVYREHGQIACIVVPKREVAAVFSRKSSEALVAQGAQHLDGKVSRSQIQLVAIGAYQLEQCLRAAARLAKSGLQPLVTYMLEPGKFRVPRDAIEAAFVASDDQIAELFPAKVPRVIVTHTRPEPMAGVLRRLDSGPQETRYLGFRNRGGTLDTAGLLFANGATWAHIVAEACRATDSDFSGFLSKEEQLALSGQGDPLAVMR